jgi:hypothetical protein
MIKEVHLFDFDPDWALNDSDVREHVHRELGTSHDIRKERLR